MLSERSRRGNGGSGPLHLALQLCRGGEMADTPALGAGGRKVVRVRIPLPAPWIQSTSQHREIRVTPRNRLAAFSRLTRQRTPYDWTKRRSVTGLPARRLRGPPNDREPHNARRPFDRQRRTFSEFSVGTHLWSDSRPVRKGPIRKLPTGRQWPLSALASVSMPGRRTAGGQERPRQRRFAKSP
jgi:hypothetical protein